MLDKWKFNSLLEDNPVEFVRSLGWIFRPTSARLLFAQVVLPERKGYMVIFQGKVHDRIKKKSRARSRESATRQPGNELWI